MTRSRNKRYPNYSLSVAIEHIHKVLDADWTNSLSREVVAQHLGYSGTSGASDSCIGTLRQYGLLDRTGTRELKVSQLAIDVLQPASEEKMQAAIDTAAFSPPLFLEINKHFPNRAPSNAALRNYLAQSGFKKKIVDSVAKSFSETISMTSCYVASTTPELPDAGKPNGTAEFHHTAKMKSSLAQTSRIDAPVPSAANCDGFSEWFRVKIGMNQLISIAYRGPGEVGVREIEKIISLLESQKLTLDE